MTDWTEEYKARMRAFMEKKGKKVRTDKRYDWQEDDDVSTYGWQDHEAVRHTVPADDEYGGDGCHWVVPEGAVLYERTYSQFTDTFHDDENEVGINVKGCRCACGRYDAVILRYTGTLAEVMQEITGAPARVEVEL